MQGYKFYLWCTSFHHVTKCKLTKSNAKCEAILCDDDDMDDDGDDDHDKDDDVKWIMMIMVVLLTW